MDNNKNAELTALAGEAGTGVLKGAEMAIDDLEQAGIAAKDAAADPPPPEPDMEASAEEPVTEKAAPDFAAMKDTIARLAAANDDGEAAPTENAEIVQLRELVVGLRQEVDELRADAAAREVQQNKAAGEYKDLSDRFVTFRSDLDNNQEVVIALYDLVTGVYTGAKSLVVERNGDRAAHDTDGAALQQQIMNMVDKAGPSGSGDYAGDKVFGATS